MPRGAPLQRRTMEVATPPRPTDHRGRGVNLHLPSWPFHNRATARVRPYKSKYPPRTNMTQTYDPEKHHRRSIRLPGYDYAQSGAYFVTLCTQGRECVLDDPIVSGIITDVWHALPRWFPNIDLDEFVIMPSHSHLVVWIYPAGANAEAGMDGMDANGAGARPAPTSPVGATLRLPPMRLPPMRLPCGCPRCGCPRCGCPRCGCPRCGCPER